MCQNKIYIETSEDVAKLFKELFDMFLNSSYVYRGYSKDDELSPSLLRNHQELEIDLDIFDYEKRLLKDYGRYSVQYIPPYENPIDLVASGQHYGLPTRLIDWSFDPFCSLFFAVDREKNPDEGYYKLLGIDYTKNIHFDDVPMFIGKDSKETDTNRKLLDQFLDFANAFKIEDGKLGEINSRVYKKDGISHISKILEHELETGIPKLFFCSTYDSNPRLIAQRGLFQIPRRFEDKGELCVSSDILNATDIMIWINKKLRREIKTYLAKINITTPRLFPDLSSICTYLKHKEYM